jgi:hypothetical protein
MDDADAFPRLRRMLATMIGTYGVASMFRDRGDPRLTEVYLGHRG